MCFGAHLVVVRQDRGPLDHVPELANVPAEVRAREDALGLRPDAKVGPPELRRRGPEERAHEGHQVATAFAQGRHADRKDGEAMVEVLAKRAARDHGAEIAIGGRDPPDVGRERPCAAEALEPPLLKDAQDLGLQIELQLADLVEKESPPFRELEPAAVLRVRPGERAPLVTEKLALEERVAQRRAVHRDERLARSGARDVHRAGGDLLARPRFAEQEHRRVRARHLLERGLHGRHDGIAVGERRQRRDLSAIGAFARPEEVAPLDRAVDEQPERGGALDGLLDVVECAGLHGVDGGLDGRVRREQDHLGVGHLGLDLGEEREAAEAGHLQVRDDDVERVSVEERGGFLPIGRGGDLVTLALEGGGDERSDPFFVVDHEDTRHARGA